MARFSTRSSRNYARKARRTTKYGKYMRASGSRAIIGRGAGGRFVKRRAPIYHSPFSASSELVQLKYTDTISLSPAASDSTSTNYQFSFNNLYDPDYSGSGHQPMYFDNFSQVWGRYCVRFAKIKCTVIDHEINTRIWNGTAALSNPSGAYKIAIIRDENNSDVPTSMNSLIEQNSRNITWRFVSPSLTGKLPKLSMKCAPAKLANVDFNDDTLQSAMNAGPNRNIRGTIVVAPADPLSVVAPPTAKIYVEITYFAKLFDRVNNQPLN